MSWFQDLVDMLHYKPCIKIQRMFVEIVILGRIGLKALKNLFRASENKIVKIF